MTEVEKAIEAYKSKMEQFKYLCEAHPELSKKSKEDVKATIEGAVEIFEDCFKDLF